MKRRQQGLSRLEFAVVAALFAILVGVFLNTVRVQQEQAEKLGVELTIMSMRTALLAEIADRLIHGRAAESKDLIGSNPVRFLKGPPMGYLGEFKEVDESRLAPGSWYFDQASGELVYRPNISSNFKRLDGMGGKEIRWRIQPRGKSSGNAVTVDTLSLAPTVIFEWF
ncbi:MAG: type II secretion system protein [Bacteroidota bacterium]